MVWLCLTIDFEDVGCDVVSLKRFLWAVLRFTWHNRDLLNEIFVRFLMVSVCLYLTAIFLGGRTLVALQGLVRVGDETLMFLGNFLGEHGRFLVRVLIGASMVLLLSFKDDVVGYLTGFGIAVLRSHWGITEPIEKLVGTIMGLLALAMMMIHVCLGMAVLWLIDNLSH